ncbi:hypothetical protein ACSFA0_23265 [Variovorax sp. LT1P1]|uniref:hypothetical protein n=1 Tax=Variovorax sp. LT1P1 TaxID=3443730 RepID=UPI003F447FB0
MPELLQGNVFDHVSGPSTRLVVVFGHKGFNSMGASWIKFAQDLGPFASVNDPFEMYEEPQQVGGHWIMFVHAQGHASPALLMESLLHALAWARDKGISTVVTNGAAAASMHIAGPGEKRRLADCRARWLMALCAELESLERVRWVLTSLDDVYVRNRQALDNSDA